MDMDVAPKPNQMQTLPTPQASPSSSITTLSQKLALKPTPENPLRVVVIHGDPTKPNDILPGGHWDEDDFLAVARAREALESLGSAYQFTWLCNHDTLMDDLRKLKREERVDLVLQVRNTNRFFVKLLAL